MKFVIAILMAVAIPAHAELIPRFTGDVLMALASKPEYKATVTGYIAGIHDANFNDTVCPKKPMAYGEIRERVLEVMRANPQNNHHPAGPLVYGTLTGLFPCPKLKGAI